MRLSKRIGHLEDRSPRCSLARRFAHQEVCPPGGPILTRKALCHRSAFQEDPSPEGYLSKRITHYTTRHLRARSNLEAKVQHARAPSEASSSPKITLHKDCSQRGSLSTRISYDKDSSRRVSLLTGITLYEDRSGQGLLSTRIALEEDHSRQ